MNAAVALLEAASVAVQDCTARVRLSCNWHLLSCLMHDHLACRDQVIERIEQLAAQLVAAAAQGQLPQLTCISTAPSNVFMAQPGAAAAAAAGCQEPLGNAARIIDQLGMASGLGSGTEQLGHTGALAGDGYEGDQLAEDGDDDEGMGGPDDADGPAEVAPDAAGQQRVLRLGCRTQTRTLLANGGAQAHSIVRGGQHWLTWLTWPAGCRRVLYMSSRGVCIVLGA